MDLDEKDPHTERVEKAVILLKELLEVNAVPVGPASDALFCLALSACAQLKVPHAALVKWLADNAEVYLKTYKDEPWI